MTNTELWPRESPNGGPPCTCKPDVGKAMRCNDHFMVNGHRQESCPACMRAASRTHQHDCPQDHAHGTLCHRHFDDGDARVWEVEACEDCQAARRDEAARIQRDHTIDPAKPYGQHIPLTCVHHPDLRWHTKNIDFIGARSIFYSSREKPECSCPMGDLIPLHEAEEAKTA